MIDQRGKDIEVEKSKNHSLNEEISYLRNPQGFNSFLHTIKQFNDSATELDRLSKEKWKGLLAMDNCLEDFYNNSEKNRNEKFKKSIRRTRSRASQESNQTD